jgi:hypothetical protein
MYALESACVKIVWQRGGLLRYEVEGVASSRGTSARTSAERTCDQNRSDETKERWRERELERESGDVAEGKFDVAR